MYDDDDVVVMMMMWLMLLLLLLLLLLMMMMMMALTVVVLLRRFFFFCVRRPCHQILSLSDAANPAVRLRTNGDPLPFSRAWLSGPHCLVTLLCVHGAGCCDVKLFVFLVPEAKVTSIFFLYKNCCRFFLKLWFTD